MERGVRGVQVKGRRLERAVRHVTDLWFPASPELLLAIRQDLDKGVYREDRELLYNTIRQDFSLFFHCLGRLVEKARENQKGENYRLTSPEKIFQEADYDYLRELLSEETTQLSRHSYNKTGKLQAQRMQEAAISAATAQTLAPEYELEPEAGFTGALVRQLGLTLIAFNYPSVYEEELSALTPKESFDARLAMRLGFSPMVLAHTILHRWGCDTEQLLVEGDEEVGAISRTMRKVCEVGETLARANFPDSYPDSTEDWDIAREQIEKALGKKGMRLIKAALKENTKTLAKFSSNIFRGGILLDPEMQISSYWDEHHLRRNPFIAGCIKQFRIRLHLFYESISRDAVPQDALGTLVKDIIPLSGFENGCVFTIDPSTRMLLPQFKIGKTKIRVLEPVRIDAVHDPVAQAFNTFSPLVTYEMDPASSSSTAIFAGVIGFSQRIGVLYLEMPASKYTRAETDYEAHFRALCKAFSDTLSLG
jgi:hypothetical protein